eukprot:5594233-Amphidinium_carterae.1
MSSPQHRPHTELNISQFTWTSTSTSSIHIATLRPQLRPQHQTIQVDIDHIPKEFASTSTPTSPKSHDIATTSKSTSAISLGHRTHHQKVRSSSLTGTSTASSKNLLPHRPQHQQVHTTSTASSKSWLHHIENIIDFIIIE